MGIGNAVAARIGAAVAVACLSAACLFALGADPSAAYPLGDGGLFYAILRQILDGHMAWLHVVRYNGFTIPFAYSPLAFYCVAWIAKAFSLTIGRAMNVWVFAWDALIAPAAYYAARRFLKTRAEAIVATAFLIAYAPGDHVWFGQGGGVTRAPAFVFLTIGSGLAWSAFARASVARAALAGVCGALVLWLHMEYALLFAVTMLVLIAFARPKVSVAATLIGTGIALTVPWAALMREHVDAFAAALHTSRMSSFGIVFAAYFGILGMGWWIGLWGFLCAAVAALQRRSLWLVWIVVLTVVDSRAGPLAAHLPSALAIGWAFGAVRTATGKEGLAPLIAVTAVVFQAALLTARSNANECFRLGAPDIANMQRIAADTEPSAWVISLFPGGLERPFFRDLTYDWLPPLAGRRSPIAFAGLEWIDPGLFMQRYGDYVHVENDCVREGPDCITAFAAQRIPPGEPAYVYVPNHGAPYPVVRAAFEGDRRFAEVFATPAGALFRLKRAT